jgi:hypothetical protein
MASQSRKICVADSASSRHLKQLGSSVNPSLKRCPLRWQYPVNSPITHLNWSLFTFNRSFVLLAEGSGINPSVWVQLWLPSVCRDFCFWPLSWQLQLRCRKLVQVLWADVQILFLPADPPFHYPQYPHDLAPISVVQLEYLVATVQGQLRSGRAGPFVKVEGCCD